MAQQVLKYLNDVCKLDFTKCRGLSYDKAANMSGRYNGMQQSFWMQISLPYMYPAQFIHRIWWDEMPWVPAKL